MSHFSSQFRKQVHFSPLLPDPASLLPVRLPILNIAYAPSDPAPTRRIPPSRYKRGAKMNEAQVKQQIQQMVSFIRQEANDKANEIRVKAEEDFNIRKLSAVEAAREKIRAEYEKKVKQIDVNRRIAQSTEQNAARLEILKARDSILQDTYEDAGKQLADLPTTDAPAYHLFLQALVLQGLVVLADPEVVVRCRRADLDAIDTLLPAVTEDYVAATNNPVTVVLDHDTFLADSCTGGVVLLSQGGTIVVENTFESRLEIAYQQNLPKIRTVMFGDS